MRIGAFLGGMTEVMCNPIVNKIRSLGGRFIFGEPVESVILENNKVAGVRAKSGMEYSASETVIATTLPSAKNILMPLKKNIFLSKLYDLPAMSACTIQLELDKPALEKDITVFGPGTDMVSFAEQSRSTFRNLSGRLSVILGNPNEYIDKEADDILKTVIKQMESLGVNLDKDGILNYRKVAEKDEFYSLDKGSQKLRPTQKTDIPGLTLAGDYTLTPSFATMEGAVISGQLAAKECIKNIDG